MTGSVPCLAVVYALVGRRLTFPREDEVVQDDDTGVDNLGGVLEAAVQTLSQHRKLLLDPSE